MDRDLNTPEIQSLEKLPLRDNATPVHTVPEEYDDKNQDSRYEELTPYTGVDEHCDDGSHGLTVEEAARWRLGALIISWISIVLISILGAVSFVVSVETNSAAAYGFGFDCILDIFTSIIVVWRFYGSVGTLYSAERERISLTFLGIVFTLASISIIVRAIVNLASDEHTIPHYSLYVLAATSGSICMVLAFIKFIIANKLDSRCLRTDGLSSVAGGILGFSILISTEVIKHNKEIWFLDETIAICVGVFLGFYGARLLVEVFVEAAVQKKIAAFCCCEEKKSDSSNVI